MGSSAAAGIHQLGGTAQLRNLPIDLNQSLDDVAELTCKLSTGYAPTLTGSVTNPTGFTLDYGTFEKHGDWVDCEFGWTVAAGFGIGSGDYRIGFPVALPPLGSRAVQPLGLAAVKGILIPHIIAVDSGGFAVIVNTATGSKLGSTGPGGVAWVAGNIIGGTMRYRWR